MVILIRLNIEHLHKTVKVCDEVRDLAFSREVDQPQVVVKHVLVLVVKHGDLDYGGSVHLVLHAALVLRTRHDRLVQGPVNVTDQQMVRGFALLVPVD